MLGKLLKYEFKSQLKIYAAVYIFTILLGFVSLMFDKLNGAYPENTVFLTLHGFAFVLMVIAMVGIFIATLIFCIIRYRNNLLRDEGYLMHTLPVSPWSLQFSKLIVACFWFAADVIIAGLTYGISVWSFSWVKYIKDLFTSTNENIPGWFIPVTLILLVFSMVASIGQFYISMQIGHLSYNSKDLMSFVAYIITYIVMQILSTIILVITSLTSMGSLQKLMTAETVPLEYFKGIYVGSVIQVIILIVVFNVGCVWIMKKKLNLE
jgi:hypothetical protein